MTTWVEFPLRVVGQPWPGLNTRGGLLDNGTGQLEDGSINQIINEADILEKRPGFIRGLNERFNGPVCGLFRYTDECGREFLLVADQEQISIRTPFEIPIFTISDAYPNDSFEGDLDTDSWQNAADYEAFGGALRLISVADLGPTITDDRFLRWFKPAANVSYETEVQYEFSTSTDDLQVLAISMKRSGLATYIVSSITLSGTTYKVLTEQVINGIRTNLSESPLSGISNRNGFLRLSYNSTSRIVTTRVIPSGGAIVTLNSEPLTELNGSNLGQGTALGLSVSNPVAIDGLRILAVTSAPDLP